tara:strand:+ start:1711 stop:2409 length:699 start_codon:yes stop_codon:yes gene_type:complete
MSFDRASRVIINSKEQSISSGDVKTTLSHAPSLRNMNDGEQVFARESNKPLALYKKFKGVLWKSNFSTNGSQIVEDKLTVKRLEYKTEFTDYRIFTHNITGDIGTAEAYLAWFTGRGDSNMDNANTAYLTPYRMTCEKIVFRPEVLTDTSADLTFKIKKQDDGDVTVDTVATATYTATLASHTSIVINKKDFDNTPVVGDKDKVAISVTAGADPSGTIDWYATSVWKVEIKV